MYDKDSMEKGGDCESELDEEEAECVVKIEVRVDVVACGVGFMGKTSEGKSLMVSD